MLKLKTKRKKSENRERKNVSTWCVKQPDSMRKNFCFCPRSTAIITISAHKNDQKNGLLNYFWRTEKQLRPLVALDSEVGGAATYRQKKRESFKRRKNPAFQCFVPLMVGVWFRSCMQQMTLRAGATAVGKAATRKKKVAPERKSYSQMVCVWFCDPQKQNCFLYSGSSMVLAKTSNVLVNDKQKLKKEKKGQFSLSLRWFETKKCV